MPEYHCDRGVLKAGEGLAISIYQISVASPTKLLQSIYFLRYGNTADTRDSSFLIKFVE